MSTGKNPSTSDGLGGVHNVQQSRPPMPACEPDLQDVKPVARGPRAADEDQMQVDPALEERVINIVSGLEISSKDARAAAPTTSAWEASPPAEPKS